MGKKGAERIRMKKKLIVWLLLLCFMLSPCRIRDVYAEEGQAETEAVDTDTNTIKKLQLYAKSAVLMDADSGRILYSQDGDNVMAMASTTKIMTCIVALENANLDDVYTVSSYAAGMPHVKLGVVSGETYRLEDLLYSLMLESHNDVAVVIAEGVAGSVEAFAALMNKKARELGCENTNFVTPNGLDAVGHETTSAELAMIARYAIKNDEFIKITNTQSYAFQSTNGKRSFSVVNHNAFLSLMSGAFGVKTGFTGKAGYCFVGALRREEKTFIAVVLACGWPPNKTYKWHDMKLLMNYGLDNYEYEDVFEPVEEFRTIPVMDGKIGEVHTEIEGSLSLLLNEEENITITYDVPDTVDAPVTEGQVVGYANLLINDELYCKFPVVTKEADEKIDYKYCLDKVLKAFVP